MIVSIETILANVVLFGCLPGVASLAAPQDQADLGGIEQQLRTQYALTKVADGGNVAQPGAILVVRFFGIKANPVSGNIYWPNSYKSGGRLVILCLSPSAASAKWWTTRGTFRLAKTCM
jgi:hypothetical protein